MKNYAGNREADESIAAELKEAGIEVCKLPEIMREDHAEMRTIVIGQIGQWGFERKWYYWVAKGPGLPLEYAEPLHESHGQEVRVSGHCMCPSPREYYDGFGVPYYHVDSQEGLNALAAALRKCVAESEKRCSETS